jgi:pimeloyl-ACP methyl ester carboxylesterase
MSCAAGGMTLNGKVRVMLKVRRAVALAWAAALVCGLVARGAAGVREERVSALVRVGRDDGRRVPVILIHGIHGLGPDQNRLAANDYWKAFLVELRAQDAELRGRFAVYVFQYYTNRKDVREIARELGAWVDETLADRPHLILAHSMGGLVARAYMVYHRHRGGRWAGTTGGDTTVGLVTLATPHHGTPAANDPEALKSHTAFGWGTVMKGGNYAYWWLNAGFLSAPFLDSRAANRSDLRWDNYDRAIPSNDLPGDDVNRWLASVNRDFAPYQGKTIAYAGALRPLSPYLAPEAIKALVEQRTAALNLHRALEITNELLTRGLSGRFDATDGLVPVKSALLCDPPARRASATTGSTYLCTSPVRVRRFEPGGRGLERVSLPANTLSIRLRPRGYDHIDMLEDPDVLRYVIQDLRAFTNPPTPPRAALRRQR